MFQPPKGTRDILPEEMEKMEFVKSVLKRTFEKYGFRPLETPAFESFELLSAKGGAGEAIKDEIYYFEDKSGRPLGLRFDLTVPLARVLANNPDLPKPFKRYQIGKVWRYDNPQSMRWREFSQADIDIVGSSSLLTDTECAACFTECLKNLGFKDFYIRLNNRKLIENLLLAIGVKKDKVLDVFRTIDKFDKIGLDGVKKELKDKGFNPEKITKLIKNSGTNKEILDRLREEFGTSEGLEELREILSLSKSFGVEKYLKIDLSLVRGLEYYTGPVFEVMLKKADVSIGGGGRYDNLIKTFGGPDLPATGLSFGLDRLLSLVEGFDSKRTKILVAPVEESLREKALSVCQEIRGQGFACEIDLMDRKFSKQLDYANSLKIPYVVIIGRKELKQKKVKLKDMKTGKEKLISLKDLKKSIK